MKLRIISLFACATMLQGCALFTQSRVVFVQSGTPVRLDSDCKGHVFVRDADGKWIRSSKKVKLPAGWYAGELKQP